MREKKPGIYKLKTFKGQNVKMVLDLKFWGWGFTYYFHYHTYLYDIMYVGFVCRVHIPQQPNTHVCMHLFKF